MEMVEVLREGNEQAVRSTACAWWFGDIACDHVKKEKKGGAMMTIVEMIKSLAFQLLRSASPEATIEGLDAARIQGLHSKEEWVDLLCAVVRSVGRMRFLLMGMGMGMGMDRKGLGETGGDTGRRLIAEQETASLLLPGGQGQRRRRR